MLFLVEATGEACSSTRAVRRSAPRIGWSGRRPVAGLPDGGDEGGECGEGDRGVANAGVWYAAESAGPLGGAGRSVEEDPPSRGVCRLLSPSSSEDGSPMSRMRLSSSATICSHTYCLAILRSCSVAMCRSRPASLQKTFVVSVVLICCCIQASTGGGMFRITASLLGAFFHRVPPLVTA